MAGVSNPTVLTADQVLTDAESQAAATAALNAYDPPTNAEMIAGLKLASDHYNYLAVTCDFSGAPWAASGQHQVLAVSGWVRILIIPHITEVLAYAVAPPSSLGDPNTSDNIIANSDLSDAAYTEGIWVDATPATGLRAFSTLKDIVTTADVVIDHESGAATDGTIVFHVLWKALSAGATVAAGDGS